MTTESYSWLERVLQGSIRHRWLVLLATLVMASVGVYHARSLPIDAVPDITNVQVQVNTEAPGYTPLEAEQRITFPVETAMAGLPGLSDTRSISRYGLSQVTVVFEDGTDIYFARQLVNERLQQARTQLPSGIQPAMGPIATGLGEIFMYTVEAKPGSKRTDGREWTAMDLRELQDWVVRPQLRNLRGVTEVNTIGGFDKQFHVTPWPDKLRAYGITLQDIMVALARNNENAGAGFIERNGEQYLIRIPGQLQGVATGVLAVFGAVPKANSMRFEMPSPSASSLGPFSVTPSSSSACQTDQLVVGGALFVTTADCMRWGLPEAMTEPRITTPVVGVISSTAQLIGKGGGPPIYA
jgi:cobalt-zinc-cadmium resistance protein CzcA